MALKLFDLMSDKIQLMIDSDAWALGVTWLGAQSLQEPGRTL